MLALGSGCSGAARHEDSPAPVSSPDAGDVSDASPPELFGAPATLSTGEPARALEVLSSPAGLHVALAYELSSRVQLLSHGADGALADAGVFASGTGPRALVAFDADGDGAIDLAAAEPAGKTLTLLGSKADGTLELRTTVATDRPAMSVDAADFDGDGAPDLLVSEGVNASEAALELWFQKSGALVRRDPPFDLAGVSSVSAAELTGDARPDAVAVFQGSGALALLQNDGTGKLSVLRTIQVCAMPSTARVLGGTPGHPVLAVACHSGGIDLVRDATQSPSVEHLDLEATLGDLLVADVDGNGAPDLLSADAFAHRVYLWLADGKGGFRAPTTFQAGRGPIALRAADLDADGDLDLIVLSYESRTVEVLHNGLNPHHGEKQ